MPVPQVGKKVFLNQLNCMVRPVIATVIAIPHGPARARIRVGTRLNALIISGPIPLRAGPILVDNPAATPAKILPKPLSLPFNLSNAEPAESESFFLFLSSLSVSFISSVRPLKFFLVSLALPPRPPIAAPAEPKPLTSPAAPILPSHHSIDFNGPGNIFHAKYSPPAAIASCFIPGI